METTNKAWDGSASRWPDSASFCKSCLIDENTSGSDKVQAKCHLPIYEPDGTLNLNALGPAVGALAGARGQSVDATPASKQKAAAKLRSIYTQLKRPIPDTIKQ